MTTMPQLPAIVGSAAARKDMQARDDLRESGWTFWERRTINIHRVVGLLRAQRQPADAQTLDAELRSVLARDFKRAWWRGIAYGVVVEADVPAWPSDDLQVMVDARENSHGTMQWVILVNATAQRVTGVHTWAEGFLSPVYWTVLLSVKEQGYRVSSVRKEKNGLMRVLTAVADGQARVFTGRPAFPEFRDPFPAAKIDPKKKE
jgi:hypothetical protein